MFIPFIRCGKQSKRPSWKSTTCLSGTCRNIAKKTPEMGAHQTVRNVSLPTPGPKQWLPPLCRPPPPHMMCGKLSFLKRCLKHNGQWVIYIWPFSSPHVTVHMTPEIELHVVGTRWKGRCSYIRSNGELHIQEDKFVHSTASLGRKVKRWTIVMRGHELWQVVMLYLSACLY